MSAPPDASPDPELDGPAAGAGGLSGLTVVVTGGNGGIGLGLARGAARAGADVALWARDPDKGRAAVDALGDTGRRIAFVACDVADERSVADAAERTRADLGPIDALFANAGVTGHAVPFEEMTLAEWRAVHAVNLDGTFLCLQAAARQMIAAGRPGALIGVASTSVYYGTPLRPHYAASKAGVASLCRSVAVALARHRIRCNALIPGWADTAMMDHARDNERFVDNTIGRTPVRRWGTPADFEAVAAFLADPRQSFHTGDSVVVDGGYTVF